MLSDSSSADLPSSDVSSEDEVSVAITCHNKKRIIVKFVVTVGIVLAGS